MKIKKADYLTMEVVADKLGCEPDAEAIVVAIDRLHKRIAKLKLRPLSLADAENKARPDKRSVRRVTRVA